MRRSTTTCDRCRREGADVQILGVTVKRKKLVRIAHGPQAGIFDLCIDCWRALESWLSPDNANFGDSGGRGPGWREVCSHNIPCGGSCPNPYLQRVR
jgi:hypothetical protein